MVDSWLTLYMCVQSPALKLLLERYPDLLSKSTEQLEQELDAKFDKAIRTKGTRPHGPLHFKLKLESGA